MKTAITLIAAVALTACGPKQPQQPIGSAALTQVVGQFEDCTLYRTNTHLGPDVTWVRCKKEPKVVEANHTESCGKGCTRHVKTVTVEEVDK